MVTDSWHKVQESTTYFKFSTNPCIFSIARCFGQRLQPIFRQFVNLINHNTIQWYSRWNVSNRMLSEEKSKRNWSMLMSSQDTTLLLYLAMSKYRYLVSDYSNNFPIKVNDVTIKIQLKSKNWAPQKGSKSIRCIRFISHY